MDDYLEDGNDLIVERCWICFTDIYVNRDSLFETNNSWDSLMKENSDSKDSKCLDGVIYAGNEYRDVVISPCNCAGSTKYVHRSCLVTYICINFVKNSHSPTPINFNPDDVTDDFINNQIDQILANRAVPANQVNTDRLSLFPKCPNCSKYYNLSYPPPTADSFLVRLSSHPVMEAISNFRRSFFLSTYITSGGFLVIFLLKSYGKHVLKTALTERLFYIYKLERNSILLNLDYINFGLFNFFVSSIHISNLFNKFIIKQLFLNCLKRNTIDLNYYSLGDLSEFSPTSNISLRSIIVNLYTPSICRFIGDLLLSLDYHPLTRYCIGMGVYLGIKGIYFCFKNYFRYKRLFNFVLGKKQPQLL